MLPSVALGAEFSLYLELCQHVWWSAILPGGASKIDPVLVIKLLKENPYNICHFVSIDT